MTASTLPPMPPDLHVGMTTTEIIKAHVALRSWAEACRADRDALRAALRNILNSDMAQFAEDEGRKVPELEAARAAIGLPDSSNSQGQEGG